MAAWLDIELTTSIAKSAMMTAAIIRLSSPGQTKMLLSWQSSSGQCLNHQL
jgi:hypothetical protein